MDRHEIALSKVCRVGGRKFSALSRSTAYPVIDFADELRKCFGISVENDVRGVHPPSICVVCRQVVLRFHEAVAAGRQGYAVRGGGCGTPVEWVPHSRTNCIFCCMLDEHRCGGRPKKKRRLPPTRPEALKSKEEELDHASREIVSEIAMDVADDHVSQQKDVQDTLLEKQQPFCKMLSNKVNPNDNAKPGTDCTLVELLHSATPDYRPSEASVLSIDRMPHSFLDLLCAVCQLLINQAVETPCCHQLCAVSILSG